MTQTTESSGQSKNNNPLIVKFRLLRKPFKEDQIEWRVQQSGFKSNGEPWVQIVPYVDARAIMERFDEVFYPFGWRDEYYEWKEGVKCRISVLVGNQWVWKEDGSENTDIESFKGGISKAFVRCAVKWGVGRSLYNTPPQFAEIVKQGGHRIQIKDKKTQKTGWYRWQVPKK